MKKSPLYIDIVTLFPGFFVSPLQESIVKIAQEKQAVEITVHDLRDYTYDRHRTCDDKPFGGGPGMVMKPEPIFECIEKIKAERPKSTVVFMSPQGEPLKQEKLTRFSQYDGLIILCGHYEGVDQRVIDHLVDEEVSIGDYVLTGGEIPALCLLDGIVRLIPGVLGNTESLEYESFQAGLLDYPHYTRPQEYRGLSVPKVLVSGNHQAVREWRLAQAVKNTKERRDDLLSEADK